jgi:HlyD family secretion protein
MRTWILRALLPAAGLLLLLWAVWLRPDPVPVRVAPVERARVEASVTNSKAGTVRARRRAKLSPEVGGRVIELTHREGEQVEAGEVLLRLDDSTPRAQLRLAEEGLRVAEASAAEACIARDRASRELARQRSLADRQIVSADLLDELESAHRASEAGCSARRAEVDRAQAAIAAAHIDLEKFTLRAPFAGVIAEQDVELGEWVTPSPPLLIAPPALDVIDPGSVYVSAPLDEVDSARIRVGQPAKVTVDSHRGEVFEGRVVRVAPYVLDVEAQNRTVEVEVELADAARAAQLLPGTSADIEVVLESRDAVLRIPTAALLEGDRVLVANGGRLEERAVEVGLRNWDWAEIESGLDEGQAVVTSLDREEVKAGARVAIQAEPARP